jgi:Tol biopolymer transport system component
VIDPNRLSSQQVLEQLPTIGAADEYFAPTSWSPDGEKLAGNRSFTDRVAPGGVYVYTFATRTFDMVVGRASGARWLNDNRRLIYPDSTINKIFLVDTLSPKPVEIFSTSRNLGALRLSPDNRTIYYSLSRADSAVWQMSLPPGS